MSQSESKADEQAIRELVRAQARRLSWTAAQPADWEGYKEGYLPDGVMVASARPARAVPVDSFLERMKALSRGNLRTFEEKALNGVVHVFGSVAVALIAGETLENGSDVNRDVSGYLLVKEEGRWRIAAQAWDKERPDRKVPAEMLSDR